MWLESLVPVQAEAVDALAARAAAVDGQDPLNEEARLTRGATTSRHLLVETHGELVAYLVHSLEHGTAQLVVDPAHRRRGVGTSLALRLRQEYPVRLWAFGDSPAARGFTGHLGLVPGRALLVMERSLWATPTAGELPPTTNEAGSSGESAGPINLRAFAPGDAEALLAVNAAAFAHHPEQGGLDAAGLAARMAEDWFDPEGLIVATEGEELLGFHWTKRHSSELGEVYVIGVDPVAQGRGLGRRLLAAGLDHLAEAGCGRVILYVDSADSVAVQMYETAGFSVAHRDVLYLPAGEELP